MDLENNYRSDIVRRNQRRNLEDRDHKLMMSMCGILGYSAVMNFVVGIARVVAGSHSIADAATGLVLGPLYAVAAHQMWFKSSPKWWLIVLPAVISMVIAVAAILMGTLAIVPLLLNAVLLALIPMRIKAQKALDSVQ